MLPDNFRFFDKSNIDEYLKELGKRYRKMNGKHVPAELILIGGASVLINYGFRDTTNDIDALMSASSVMKEIANTMSDEYGLPNGWLNDDFRRTNSYSSNLFQYSKYYKTFSNVLRVYTISEEYLIAMKLRSARKYKRDLSDIIGILKEQKQNSAPITMDKLDRAITNLYGSWDCISDEMKAFIKNILNDSEFDNKYNEIKDLESLNKQNLIAFEDNYPDILKSENIDSVLNKLTKIQDQNPEDQDTNSNNSN